MVKRIINNFQLFSISNFTYNATGSCCTYKHEYNAMTHMELSTMQMIVYDMCVCVCANSIYLFVFSFFSSFVHKLFDHDSYMH